MTRRGAKRLGPLQLKILQVLWDRGPSYVADVVQRLAPEEDLAYTTVATMLRKMERRGLVKHRQEGRRFVYEAAVSEERVAREMTGDLVDRVFAGSLTDLVSQLLESREVSADELDELERIIEEKRTQK